MVTVSPQEIVFRQPGEANVGISGSQALNQPQGSVNVRFGQQPQNSTLQLGFSGNMSGNGNGDIEKSVLNMLGESTKSVPGTNGGNLACAHVASKALINAGVLNSSEHTLSCGVLEETLKKKGARRVEGPNFPPGAVVFVGAEGTQGGSGQHVGIHTSQGVVANSSSKKEVATGWNPQSDSRGNVRAWVLPGSFNTIS